MRRRGGHLFLALSLLVAGCAAGRATPPAGPGFERGGVPDLRGSRVLVLPLQLNSGVHPDIGREIDYALSTRGAGEGEWILPDALRELLRTNAATSIRIDALPVDVFLSREVDRVGDPLFGDLYRLGVMAGAEYALLPVEARARIAEDGEEVAEIAVALIEVRTGRVFWFGIVGGSAGEPRALSSAASAADALARRVAR